MPKSTTKPKATDWERVKREALQEAPIAHAEDDGPYDPNDAAAAAALFALVWPHIQKSAGAIIASTAIIASVLLSLVLPSGPPVLLGALCAVVVGFMLNRGKHE